MTLMQTLRFSSLDVDTQSYVNHEILFFNTRRLSIISWAVLAVEALNIINVMFFSKSGLATVNNRQYFIMYLLLFVSAGVCLVVQRLLRNKPMLLQGCYIGLTLDWVLWNSLLSAMDLRRNPSITVFIIGIFGLSLLIRLKPWESFCIFSSGYLLLIYCARNVIPSGIVINAAILTLVAVIIACSRYFSMLEELGSRIKMILQANHRMEEKQKLGLLLDQQKELLHYNNKLMFVWDKEENILILNNNKDLCFPDRETLISRFTKSHGKIDETLVLCLDQEKPPCEYQIESTIQFDCDHKPMGAVGSLTYINEVRGLT